MKYIKQYESFKNTDNKLNELIHNDYFSLDILLPLVNKNLSTIEIMEESNKILEKFNILFLSIDDYCKIDTNINKSEIRNRFIIPPVNIVSYLPENNKIYVVISTYLPDELQLNSIFDSKFDFDRFKNILEDVIEHEMIHVKQAEKKGLENIKDINPTNSKEYFSNPDELMAFSYTIAKNIFRQYNSIPKNLSNVLSYDRLWNDIKRSLNYDKDLIKKYQKYIYQYLDKMVDKSKE